MVGFIGDISRIRGSGVFLRWPKISFLAKRKLVILVYGAVMQSYSLYSNGTMQWVIGFEESAINPETTA